MIERWMEEGIQAARAGNRQQAAQYFSSVVNADPNNQEAWLWLSDVTDDPARRLEILNWLVQVDPQNRRARSRLNVLHQQMAGGSPPARTAPQYPPANAPAAGGSTLRTAPATAAPAGAPVYQKSAGKEKWILISLSILLVICLVGVGGVYIGSKLLQPSGGIAAAGPVEETEARSPVIEAAGTLPAPLPTETAVPLPPTPTMAPEPTATSAPEPTATPVPLPDFRDDFENGISDMWYGDISAVKINNGRLGIKDPFSKIFIGDPGWNNYSLSFDVCVDEYGEDAVFAGMDILFHVKPRGSDDFSAYGFDFFGRLDNLRQYPDVLNSIEYTDRGGYDEILDEIEMDFRFWESNCNQVKLVVRGKNADLFWNDNPIYTVGSVQPLDGAVGFDFYDYITIDNVVVQPLP